MASRSFSKVARGPLARQLAAPAAAAQRRSFVAAAGLTRATAVAAARTALAGPAQQQVRGVKTIDFAGHKEQVWGECLKSDCWWLDAVATSVGPKRGGCVSARS